MNVSIYTTSTCGYCAAVKEFLKKNDIEYTEYDVGANKEKAREMIEMSGQMGVPYIVVDTGTETHGIVGFDEQKLSGALGI